MFGEPTKYLILSIKKTARWWDFISLSLYPSLTLFLSLSLSLALSLSFSLSLYLSIYLSFSLSLSTFSISLYLCLISVTLSLTLQVLYMEEKRYRRWRGAGDGGGGNRQKQFWFITLAIHTFRFGLYKYKFYNILIVSSLYEILKASLRLKSGLFANYLYIIAKTYCYKNKSILLNIRYESSRSSVSTKYRKSTQLGTLNLNWNTLKTTQRLLNFDSK